MKNNYLRILAAAVVSYVAILLFTCMPSFESYALNQYTVSSPVIQDNPDCLKHIFEAEAKYKIPSGLLLSIAMVESGKDGTPHPYALNLNGKAVYTDSIEDASVQIRQKNGKVKRNISVGCMQLQVYYHKHEFETLDHMLQPEDNVDYAAQFLADLFQRTKSWTRAVRRYNGGSSEQTQKYLCKVSSHLEHLNLDSNKLLATKPCSKKAKPYISDATKEAYALRDGYEG